MLEHGREDITLWARYYFDFTPLAFQHKFYHDPRKDKLLVAGVRTGKTKGLALGFLHYMMYHPNCRLGNASSSADQAKIMFDDCSELMASPLFQHWIEDVQKSPYPLIRLVNGAEATFRSVGYEAELWRGREYDWINIDEAAYIVREMAVKTLKGRLLGPGRAGILTMTTTPKGKGWLFERWKLGALKPDGQPQFPQHYDPHYLSMLARTRDNIHLTEEQIQDLERDYTLRMKQQEIEGLFLDSEGLVFPWDQIQFATAEEVNPHVKALNARLHQWLADHHISDRGGDIVYYALDPEPGHLYINSWDLGKKPTRSGRNATVGGVLDITHKPWELVAFRYEPGAGYGIAHDYIKEWNSLYGGVGNCETVIDATGKGDPINERLQEEEHIDVDGFIYTGVTKPQIVMAIQVMLEKGWFAAPFIRRLVDQLQGYEHDDKDLPQDIVMMLGQAAYKARQRWGEAQQIKVTQRQVGGRKGMGDPSMERYKDRRRASRMTRIGERRRSARYNVRLLTA